MKSVTYVLYEEDVDYCVLVDCGEWETLKPVLERIDKRVRAVLLTHGHCDHIYGLLGLLKDYPHVEVYSTEYGHTELHNDRKNMSIYFGQAFTFEGYQQKTLQGGEYLNFEGLCDMEIISTPGHSPSCLTYMIGKELFTGDAYMPGVKAFSKFPGGNKNLAEKSIALLSDMESKGYTIHCGHHSY